MIYYLAPVQGHTDAAYRHFHASIYSGADGVVYTTPFIRLEKGEIRKKDLRDAFSDLNAPQVVVPQVIFRDGQELSALVQKLKEENPALPRIDINMGCPFPLQTSRGRGAATLADAACREAVRSVVEGNPDVNFSVKMRLGYRDEEWQEALEMLNSLQLDHIAVHPRTAADQYTGALHMEAFDAIYENSKNPVVYNGDILTPADAAAIVEKYPRLHGLMIGRGVLGRPSLITEIREGAEWDAERRIKMMLEFHRVLLAHYRDTLIGGDHQVLSKISPFWEYAESEIGRKAWKAIRKATTMAKYQTALALI